MNELDLPPGWMPKIPPTVALFSPTFCKVAYYHAPTLLMWLGTQARRFARMALAWLALLAHAWLWELHVAMTEPGPRIYLAQ